MDTKALRQKILDLATRGKLVPQDPNDEPASVLLERIRAEKQQMVKDGKLKPKDIKNDTIIFVGEDNLHYEKFQDGTVKCIENEIPFEVPEGWAWCRLKHVCTMAAGKAKPTDQIMTEPFEGCYPCFGGNGIRGYVDEYNQDGIFSIVGRQGALCGNINIAKGKFYATEHAVVTTLFSGIDFNWSNYVLEALQLNSYATGAAQPGLSVANVLNVFVPVPPTQEQVHIGIRIAESIKIIENIEDEKENLQTLISSAKSKILDLAIRGKLVSQNPNDEPASVLLERIRAEKEELIKQGKIKRDKKESIIFKGEDNSYYEKIGENIVDISEEIPFDIPENWSFARLEDVLVYEQPTPYIVSSTDYKNDYQTPVLTAGKSFIIGYTNETFGIKTELPVIIFDDFTTDSKYVDFPFKVKSSAMKILTAKEKLINTKFAYYAMQVVECDNYNHKRYWISEFSKKLIPLPPKKEQVEIVNAIEELYKYIEQILS